MHDLIDMERPRLHASYTALFTAWFGWWLTSLYLLAAGWTGPDWYWPSIWASFLTIEVAGWLGGDARAKTFSQHVWAAIWGAPARRVIGYGLAVALGTSAMALAPILMGTIYQVPWVWLVFAPPLAIGGAILGWLWDHLPNLGANG